MDWSKTTARLDEKHLSHDDVIKWKHFPRYWPFARGIHRSPVNSPHKGQWRGALIFSLICVWINGWVNNREADDLRRYRVHCDVIVMFGYLVRLILEILWYVLNKVANHFYYVIKVCVLIYSYAQIVFASVLRIPRLLCFIQIFTLGLKSEVLSQCFIRILILVCCPYKVYPMLHVHMYKIIMCFVLLRLSHDDIIKWKHFPRYWPFVRWIHRSPVNSPHQGQWRGILMFSLICVWINGWVNTHETGGSIRYRAHYDVIIMLWILIGMVWQIRTQMIFSTHQSHCMIIDL